MSWYSLSCFTGTKVQILTQKALADEGLGDAYLVPLIKKKVEALRISHQPGAMTWSSEMKAAVPELVALIFAVWTLHHSKKFLQAMDASDKQAYLFQPHPVQVVAIFCPHTSAYLDVC